MPSPAARPTRTATLLIATLSIIAAALAYVAPPAHAAAPVRYQVSTTTSEVHISVFGGSIATESGTLTIKDHFGNKRFSMPLTYRKDYREYPIDARVNGTTATLIPSKLVSRSVAVDASAVDPIRHQAAAPETRQERDDQALDRFNAQLNAGLTISTIIGIAIGLVVGAVVGCVLGAFAALGIGCLPGIPIGATIGGILGTVIGGGGTLIVAAFQYFQTINSPFVPPQPAR